VSKKSHRRDLNLRPTDPEADTLTTQPPRLAYVDSARNLGVKFDKNLSFAQHISAIFKSCFHNIRDFRGIRNTTDQTTVWTIATSLIHFRIDYCNSLLLNLPGTQTNGVQLVLNSAARAVIKTPKFHL